MKREDIVAELEKGGIIAVIRLLDEAKAVSIVEALLQGGVNALEVTMTVPHAIEMVEKIKKQFGNRILLGAGTVMSVEAAQKMLEVGAEFIVSPIAVPGLIDIAHRHNKPAFVGAFSPKEIFATWQEGADVVKVFPASRLGPDYFKDIHGPFPHIKLTPTGGVNLGNASEFIRCGAVFLGVGTSLLEKQLIINENWEGLAERAAQFKKSVEQARA